MNSTSTPKQWHSITSFSQAMAATGIITRDEITPDGRIHRVHVEGDKQGSKNGWYILHPEPYPTGKFGSWKLGLAVPWSQQLPGSLNKQQRAEFQKRRAETEAERRAEIARREAKARERAKWIWEHSKPAPADHPYLMSKGAKPHGSKVIRETLVLAVRDIEGSLCSLQFISRAGEKRFLSGGRTAGCSYFLGAIGERLFIAEGFATGATVHEATGDAAAITFHAGNLKPVAETLRKRYPKLDLVIVADNDEFTDRNPGLRKALEAAKAVKGKVALPKFADTSTQPTDFNDLLLLEGMDAVKAQLQHVCDPHILENVPGVLASDVRPESVSWIWKGWIPRREITMLDGDPGRGKSVITLDLAARVTRGWTMPDGSEPQCGPSGVVILSTEDSASTTIVPRLMVAGADLKRVRIITEILDSRSSSRLPELAHDAQEFEKAIRDVNAVFLIVDPLVASLDSKTDAHKDQEVRKNLAVVKRLALRTGVAVVGLRHFNKTSGGNPLYRGQGSIAFTGAARVVLLAAPDQEGHPTLAVAKSNLAVLPSSLRYTLGPPGETVRVTWEGESQRTAADLLVDSGGEEDRTIKDDAKQFLQELLSDGRVLQQEVMSEGKKQGFSEKTLRRAKKELGIKSSHDGQGRETKWYWSFPGMDKPAPDLATPPELANSAKVIEPTNINSATYHEMAKEQDTVMPRGFVPTSENGTAVDGIEQINQAADDVEPARSEHYRMPCRKAQKVRTQ